LVGRDTEYVIAEAGKTLSLQDDHRHDKGDELWHGVGALQSKAAIGLVVMDLLAGVYPNATSHLVVNDLQKDDNFTHHPLVKDEPFARFLACFPLQTPAGFVIGTQREDFVMIGG
jgi:GAF domain-containing protein